MLREAGRAAGGGRQADGQAGWRVHPASCRCCSTLPVFGSPRQTSSLRTAANRTAPHLDHGGHQEGKGHGLPRHHRIQVSQPRVLHGQACGVAQAARIPGATSMGGGRGRAGQGGSGRSGASGGWGEQPTLPCSTWTTCLTVPPASPHGWPPLTCRTSCPAPHRPTAAPHSAPQAGGTGGRGGASKNQFRTQGADMQIARTNGGRQGAATATSGGCTSLLLPVSLDVEARPAKLASDPPPCLPHTGCQTSTLRPRHTSRIATCR